MWAMEKKFYSIRVVPVNCSASSGLRIISVSEGTRAKIGKRVIENRDFFFVCPNYNNSINPAILEMALDPVCDTPLLSRRMDEGLEVVRISPDIHGVDQTLDSSHKAVGLIRVCRRTECSHYMNEPIFYDTDEDRLVCGYGDNK